MDTVHMLITTGQGPRECGLGLAGFAAPLAQEAEICGVDMDWNAQDADAPRSVLLALHGAGAAPMARAFAGLWAWRCRSPLRPTHKRALWCMEARVIPTPPHVPRLDPSTITWRTTRAGGPGGQHQNTTDSAVIASAVCPRTGRVFVASARDQRSQHRNRSVALERLEAAMAQAGLEEAAQRDAKLHAWRATRPTGVPVALLEGPKFLPKIWPILGGNNLPK